MIERKQSGVTTYYRTLANGEEASCGVSLEPRRISSKTAIKVIMDEGDKPGTKITLLVNTQEGQKSYEYFYEDLGKSPEERKQYFQVLVSTSVDWFDKIIVFHPASSNDNNEPSAFNPPALNPGKYSLKIGKDSIIETFMTQQLSEEELERLLEKQAEDMGTKTITVQNDWGNVIVGDIDPTTDDELIETVRRSDRIIIEHTFS